MPDSAAALLEGFADELEQGLFIPSADGVGLPREGLLLSDRYIVTHLAVPSASLSTIPVSIDLHGYRGRSFWQCSLGLSAAIRASVAKEYPSCPRSRVDASIEFVLFSFQATLRGARDAKGC